MSEEKNTFLESRPQSLCLMCGKCCRVVTTPEPCEKLMQIGKEGDKTAIDFLEIFEPYESIEAARVVDEKTVDNILLSITKDDLYSEKDITFYKCRHIGENNLCKIYENRKELCDRCPSSPWVIVPPGCGFEGWLNEKKDEIKQQVIKQKQNLAYAESLLAEATTPQQTERIGITIEKIKRTIAFYAKYGANDW